MAIDFPYLPMLSAEQAGGFDTMKAIGAGQSVVNKLIDTHYKNLLSKEIAEKLPYIARTAAADLENKRQQSEWNPRIWGSEINSRNEQAALHHIEAQLKKRELQYPGYGESGASGDPARLAAAEDLYPAQPGETRNVPVEQTQIADQQQGMPGITPMPGSPIDQNQMVQSLMQQNRPQIQRQEQGEPIEHPLVQALKKKMQADLIAKQNSGMGKGTAYMQEERNFANRVVLDNPWLQGDPEMAQEAVDAIKSGKSELNGRPLKISETAMDELKAINKKTSDAQERGQQRFGNTLRNLIKKAEPNEEGAFKFSGVLGKFNGNVEKAMSNVGGKTSKDYQAYEKFKTDIDSMVAEIIRVTGAHSTDAQKAQAYQTALTINGTTSPEIARIKYNEFKEMYAEIGRTVAKGGFRNRIELYNDEEEAKDVGNVMKSSTAQEGDLVWNPKTRRVE